MCLAIYKPKGVHVAKRHLSNGFYNNDDGAGFAVAYDGKLKLFKGFFTFKDFYKAWRPYKDCDAIIHFRWATHGLENEANCHPFQLGRYAMIHNGVLNISTKSDPSKSDTAHFAELVLEPMLQRVRLDSPSLRYLVEEAIGKDNKIVVLAPDGSHVIYNEAAGEWSNGAWYSNSGYSYRATQYSDYGSLSCGYVAKIGPNSLNDIYNYWKHLSDNGETALAYLDWKLLNLEMLEKVQLPQYRDGWPNSIEQAAIPEDSSAYKAMKEQFPDWEPNTLAKNSYQRSLMEDIEDEIAKDEMSEAMAIAADNAYGNNAMDN